MARHHCRGSICATAALPARVAALPENSVKATAPAASSAHAARLILILSLAPTIGLGIGRFAYSLVLPDMRDTLGWSYSVAGFMNTINAAGYLVIAAMDGDPGIARAAPVKFKIRPALIYLVSYFMFGAGYIAYMTFMIAYLRDAG